MLIRCDECGKEYSDKADKCPHCGCPNPKQIELELTFEVHKDAEREMKRRIIQVVGCSIVSLLLTNFMGGDLEQRITAFMLFEFGLSFCFEGWRIGRNIMGFFGGLIGIFAVWAIAIIVLQLLGKILPDAIEPLIGIPLMIIWGIYFLGAPIRRYREKKAAENHMDTLINGGQQ